MSNYCLSYNQSTMNNETNLSNSPKPIYSGERIFLILEYTLLINYFCHKPTIKNLSKAFF